MRLKKMFDFKYRLRGFSLIEMMTVLFIVVLLAGIAYPSYQEAVRKSKRTEGRAALMQLLQQQERYYSQHNSYIQFSFSSVDQDEKKFKWFSGNGPKSSAYEIKAEACTNDTIQNCVQLIAKPGTDNVDANFKDPICGDLKIASTGAKDASSADCWK